MDKHAWLFVLALGSMAALPSAQATEPGGTHAPEVAADLGPDRDAAMARILERWVPFIRETGKTDLTEWHLEMKGLIGKADLSALQRASERVTYAGMKANLQGRIISDEDAIGLAAERSVELGLTDEQTKALGDIDRDLVFVPLAPCRILDTRIAGGQIAANTSRAIDVTAVGNYAFQGGDSTDCSGASAAGSFAAALLTISVPGAASNGCLSAYAFNATQPVTHTLDFPLGIPISTTVSVQLDQSALSNELSIYASAQTHVVIDIVGYFINPAEPVLTCVNTAQTTLPISAGNTGNAVAPTCASGDIETATLCEATSWDMPLVFINAGTCSAKNNSGSSATLRAARRCCRVGW
ncbi:MAG: hypothetical protein IPK97_09595 [Ahniella sp.]|nr:hypothetical protein [Ahniella sp.]